MHYFHDWQDIIRKTAQLKSIIYNGKRLLIFPDLPAAYWNNVPVLTKLKTCFEIVQGSVSDFCTQRSYGFHTTERKYTSQIRYRRSHSQNSTSVKGTCRHHNLLLELYKQVTRLGWNADQTTFFFFFARCDSYYIHVRCFTAQISKDWVAYACRRTYITQIGTFHWAPASQLTSGVLYCFLQSSVMFLCKILIWCSSKPVFSGTFLFCFLILILLW